MKRFALFGLLVVLFVAVAAASAPVKMFTPAGEMLATVGN